MKERIHFLSFLGMFAVVFGMVLSGPQLNAQQNAPRTTQPPDQTQRQPTPPPDQTAPDPQAQQPSGNQVFTGTIVKSGDKYVLQDASSNNTYDIDHQDQVKKFEGKKVRVNGTLDPNGKLIHVQP